MSQTEDDPAAVGEPAVHAAEPRPAPVELLREALSRVSRAAPLEARGRFLVLTHRGPDPDALGACEGLRQLLSEAFDHEPVVATVGVIHRAENLALVEQLDLELEDYLTLEHDRFAGVLLVDTQPEFGHTVVPDDLPIVAVFDHHVPPGGGGDQPSSVPVEYRDVRLELGATSSLIWEYMRDAGLEPSARTASALFCGVRYDTADLSRNATPLDEEAYLATFRLADRAAIARIAHPPLPPVYYAELSGALACARRHGPLILALMGKVENPASVAEMADLFLRMEGCSWTLVGAEHEGGYVLSLRTDPAYGRAYPLMQRVLDGEGSFGGHGHIAGGRIPLEDAGESSVRAVERRLRTRALELLGASSEDGIPEEGRALHE
ncbi:MAG: DHH family phosphoesterase [Planctomycetes bacterium]|nr:DHH family phosphoesterase [Planctomycetota bacterium]